MASRKLLPIAVAYGDGIGPEIMSASLAIFNAAKVPLEYHSVQMGKPIYLAGHSTGMTPEAQATVEKLGILYKGPMETPKGSGVKSINVTARKVWNTYANKRVFQTIPGVDTLYSRAKIPIDITLFRENIEDTYGGIEHFQTNDVAQCRRLMTRPGSRAVHRIAFEAAQKRGAKRVTCVHKANIMKLTDGLFLEEFYNVAKYYPNIKADDVIVDDMAMKLVMKPEQYDVVVLPNLQGDIISDLCAGLVGGLGMAPSANIGDNVSIFEAVHGTAPDITGKNLANPTALLLSGLMLLRHVGLPDKAEAIHNALIQTLEQGDRTKDLEPKDPTSKSLGTREFAEAIIKRIPAEVKAEKVALPATFNPPARPEKHIMHQTAREVKEVTVGMDMFIDSSLQPPILAGKLQTHLPSHLKLTMISNRGTQVWPRGSLFTELVNHYRCRVELAKDKDGAAIKESELLGLAQAISKDVRVCSLEMLLKIGDKKGFTLAQGQ